jgi:hypothetical protein
MTYRNIPLRLFFFTKVMRGRRSVILGIGPLWITYYGKLRPRLLAYWNKKCFIGRDFDQLPARPS